ncbi:potassium transporter TrkA [Halohasta salina]|uniref:potassium transporter TrkA n=1 Tax=Halohasta salina TaxID=2961621 RepID=UPI0020A494D1|nr:potassium transporter TrkA [Halohasta salina]
MSAVPAAMLLQTGIRFEQPSVAAASLVVLALLSASTAGGVTVAYRWYFGALVPKGVAVVSGVAVVALYINTVSLGAVVGQRSVDLFRPGVVGFNVVALGVAAAAAPVGRRLGAAVAGELLALVGIEARDVEVAAMVRSVGRSTTIELPAEIEDIEGYDPVADETKADLAGKRLVFPRRLTVDELRSRLVDRLKTDYSVGFVDVDLTAEGGVDYLAVGSRAAGLGATITPGTVGVAIRADPPHNAAAGDQVQVWSAGDAPERLTTGELRGVAGETVTLAVDEGDAEVLSPAEQYRLVTLPAEPQPDREFATLLGRADETIGTVTVEAGSQLVGETPAAIGGTVMAIEPAAEPLIALPASDRPIESGDTIYVLGRPELFRQLETRASTPEPATDNDATQSDADTDAAPADESADSAKGGREAAGSADHDGRAS